ncbi:MAG: cyclic nucleotide-binding domain-containing protein, partial [Clostridiales bacterium]|nr:cyclic nucleotide-binding domain-containing protein [Clostridiales bacterium]
MINLGAIKNISRVKKCPRGSVITGEGLGSIMFILLKGEVGVYTDYRLPSAEMVKVLMAGNFFADTGLLQDKRAAYTTAALSEAIILPIERSSLHEFLQEETALTYEIIKELSLRLEQTGT